MGGSLDTSGGGLGVDEAFEDEAAGGFVQGGFGGAFGVGHHAGNIAAVIANAGDMANGSIRVGVVGGVTVGIGILKKDLIVGLLFLKRFCRTKIIAFTVGNGDSQQLTLGDAGRERGIMRGHA